MDYDALRALAGILYDKSQRYKMLYALNAPNDETERRQKFIELQIAKYEMELAKKNLKTAMGNNV